ncbi:MAG: hypothetical protein ACM3PT_07615 [Deltaproteobacteria bacterium]
MKTSMSILIAVFFLNIAFSQVTERQTNLSLGMQPCLSANIKDMKQKEVEKLWKEFFEKYGKIKYNSKAKEHFSAGVRINRIKSGDPVDVYAKFDEFADGTRFDISFDLGTGFLSKKDYPAEYQGGVEFVKDFVIFIEKYKVEQKMKAEEKALEKLNDQLKDAVKENKNLKEKIVSYEEKIVKAEQEIKENEQKQIDLEKQIQLQSIKVKDVQIEYNNIGK